MSTRVFLGNTYFGAGNFGDDLSLAGFAGVAAAFPHVEISACTSHDLAAMQRRFPAIRWLPDGEANRTASLRDADAWLALGDTPFQLDSGPWSLDHNEAERQRCAAFEKPMYLLGVGCESAAAAADPRARSLLAAAERVWARDDLSAAILRPFVRPSRLHAGADVAHLAFSVTTSAPPSEPDVAGLLLAFERREQFDLSELAGFIEGRPRPGTRWLVQETRALPYLERWILAELPASARSRLSVMEPAYASASIAEYLGAFGAPATTITSRYHGVVVAAWHGSKILVVARSAKLHGVADELGLPRIEAIGAASALETAAASAVAVPRERLLALRERARTMCELFFRACTARATAERRSDSAAPLPMTCEPLPASSMRVSIDVDDLSCLRVGEVVTVRCTIVNGGNAVCLTAPPNPITLCYRWYDAEGAAVGPGEWIHTPLARAMAPGDRLTTGARIAAPRVPATYALAITLLQEDVAWFDDVDPANGVRRTVVVEAGGTSSSDDRFYAFTSSERQRLTREAFERRAPLLHRWRDMSGPVPASWDLRAALAAEWLRTARCIVDLGCGAMALERYLAPGQAYVPVDLIARDERTIVADLDKDPLPAIEADACALLGVLAYLFEPHAVLERAGRSYGRAVVSYNVEPDPGVRLGHGWVNALTYEEVYRLFGDAGFSVVRERDFGGTLYLFELARATLTP